MVKIYHNPRCRKSRAGLEYLKSRTKDIEVVDYIGNPLSEKELQKLFAKLNLRPEEMLRTQEELYRKQFRGKKFTDEEWLKIIAGHPKLLKRPVVESGYKAVWADPPENMNILFK
ncbi:MAG: arsenate reductase family protein [Bacteroidales bacterium]|nr:arsenate reductase family protein [Bacteroidales bacterium]